MTRILGMMVAMLMLVNGAAAQQESPKVMPAGEDKVRIVPPYKNVGNFPERFYFSPNGDIVIMLESRGSREFLVYSYRQGRLLGSINFDALGLAEHGNISYVDFIDNRTISITFEKAQAVIDLPSETLRYEGNIFLGYIHHTKDESSGPITSILVDEIRKHDPVDFSVVSKEKISEDFNLRNVFYYIIPEGSSSSLPSFAFCIEAHSEKGCQIHIINSGKLKLKASYRLDVHKKNQHSHEIPITLSLDKNRVITKITYYNHGRDKSIDAMRVRDLKSGEILFEISARDADLSNLRGRLSESGVIGDRFLLLHPPTWTDEGYDYVNEIILLDLETASEERKRVPLGFYQMKRISEHKVLLITNERRLIEYDLQSLQSRKVRTISSPVKSTLAEISFLNNDKALFYFDDGRENYIDMSNLSEVHVEDEDGPLPLSASLSDSTAKGLAHRMIDDSIIYRVGDYHKGMTGEFWRIKPDGTTAAMGLFVPPNEFGPGRNFTVANNGEDFVALNRKGEFCIASIRKDSCTPIGFGSFLDKPVDLSSIEAYKNWLREYRFVIRDTVFSEDASTLYVFHEDAILHIDARTGQIRYSAKRGFNCTGAIGGALLSEDRYICSNGSEDGREYVAIIDMNKGEITEKLLVKSHSMFPGVTDNLIFSYNASEIDIFDRATMTRRAALYVFGSEDWLILTNEGFYAGPEGADRHLTVRKGLNDIYTIYKFRDALYRPDLVAEALKGDPEGLVQKAAAKVSLEKILQSGAAPEIMIEGEVQGERVLARAEITDAGGGIGRLEWRVNSVTQVTDEGRSRSSAELFLAEGENRIELVAYNRDNTIQGRSEALNFTVGADTLSPPRLFVLAVGVDEYELDPLKLKYAVRDAEAVADGFEQAGAGLYGEIFTEVLTDEEVTRATLDEKFRELSKSIRPNDVFVFFSAGHGKTLDGRFFFIPQDFSGTTQASIREQGIGHAAFQEWFSMIAAQKSLLMFDSCESGALTSDTVGRELRFRAANDLLGNATGRALMAASSSTGYALEGYEDHGVFAWSILDALTTADLDESGTIDIDELAASIEETVPRIAEEAFNDKQTPQFKPPMRGFEVVRPLQEAQVQ